MSPKCGFGVAMLPIAHYKSTGRMLGTLRFQNGQFGRTFSAASFAMFQNWGGHASGRRMLHFRVSARRICFILKTGYDRAKVPPYNGNDPRPTLVV